MRFIPLAVATALVMACAGRAAENYVIQPEDILTVTVYGHADLSQQVTVLDDGRFQYPLVGKVNAGGKSPDQVADAIAKGLIGELNAPQVTVAVRQPALRRVYVSGLVAKPGSYDLKPGWRVSHLIAEAGGLAGSLDGRGTSMTTLKPEMARGTIVRGSDTLAVDLDRAVAKSDMMADTPLEPGDLLQVQANANLIHIVGQVRTPGDYQLKDKLGALEAIAAAGGATDKAALSRTQIIRGAEVLPVDLYALLVQGKTDGNVMVLAGDTLVVPANENRIAVLGGVQSPGYYDMPDGKPLTVAEAIGLAKGAKQRARTAEVALVREVNGKQVVSKLNFQRFLNKGDLTQNPAVAPGDVVYVPDGSTVDKGLVAINSAATIASGVLLRLLFP
ncbi:MAG TPA: SLBB domain-containing protein [Armatimonadota bacterium]|jgi:polysaccharide export outer membrane protein